MSYEGYVQILCENGHYYISHAYSNEYMDDEHDESSNKNWKCPDCYSPAAWTNDVDTTNGSFYRDEITGKEERIDGYVELEPDRLVEFCTCSTCGNNHAVKQQTFKIPKEVKNG